MCRHDLSLGNENWTCGYNGPPGRHSIQMFRRCPADIPMGMPGLAVAAVPATLGSRGARIMTIHLPEDLERSIRAEVQSGHFASVDDAIAEAWRTFQLRR